MTVLTPAVSARFDELRRLTATLNDREAHLERQCTVYKAVVDFCPLAMFITDPVGLCQHVNPAYEELTGHTLRELIGFGWRNVIHPQDADKVYSEWVLATSHGAVYESMHRVVTVTKEVRRVHVVARPINGPTGLLAFVGWAVEPVSSPETDNDA